MKTVCILLLAVCCAASANARRPVRVSSPDGSIRFEAAVQGGVFRYSVSFNNGVLVEPSALGFRFADGLFEAHLQLYEVAYKDTTETYKLIVGKAGQVHIQYREALMKLRETGASGRKLNIRMRMFNDGLAFRYEFPEQRSPSLTILDEMTRFQLHGDPAVQALLLPNYTTSHEGHYSHLPFHAVAEDTLLDMPALFHFSSGVYMAVTEAALLDYAGMYLSRKGNQLVSRLSPLPHQTGVKVQARYPHRSPWRVMLISDRVGALIESNIITSLNELPATSDWSWLKPGKTTFPWWNGNVVPDTLNAPGNNFVTAQYYIDFCARNGLEYHSVVEYGLHQWYTDDGVGFQPGPHNDVTRPVPGLDLKQICDYATQKGVGIRVWVHWAALYPRLDTAFALFEQWGIRGMMVDFMDRDDQEMVNIQTEILQKAARHHLHIQFHGAYKPTGLSRTYPNEFTREGTLNYEANKWDPSGVSPDHDLDMPFTRMLAGATDYHLGGYRAVDSARFKAQYTRPLMLGTRAHMLAMYVVLENYLQMVCDYPAAYEGETGFGFICGVPTVWDETRVIAAETGRYIAIARRKGTDWYLGAINNHEERTVPIPLTFLQGAYKTDEYTDGRAGMPNELVKKSRTLTGNDTISLQLSKGGGAAVRFYR